VQLTQTHGRAKLIAAAESPTALAGSISCCNAGPTRATVDPRALGELAPTRLESGASAGAITPFGAAIKNKKQAGLQALQQRSCNRVAIGQAEAASSSAAVESHWLREPIAFSRSNCSRTPEIVVTV